MTRKAILARHVRVTFKPGSIEYTLTADAGSPLEWVSDLNGISGGGWVIPPESVNEYHPGNFLAHDLEHHYLECPADAVAVLNEESGT